MHRTLTVRISESLHRKLKAVAGIKGQGMGDTYEEAFEQYVKRFDAGDARTLFDANVKSKKEGK
jgi:predicted transcriptional regulator